MMATDEGERHTLNVTVGKGSDGTSVNVIYGAKR